MSDAITMTNRPYRSAVIEARTVAPILRTLRIRLRRLAGRIVSGLTVVFLIFDVAMKLLTPPAAVGGPGSLAGPRAPFSRSVSFN